MEVEERQRRHHQRVVDDAEMRAFATAWTTKHRWGRDPTKLGEVWVYRLSAR